MLCVKTDKNRYYKKTKRDTRGTVTNSHALRVEELSGQLEVEEEDGDRQEEEEEVESGEASQGECAMDGMEMTVNALRT